jgi:hypothetical protein
MKRGIVARLAPAVLLVALMLQPPNALAQGAQGTVGARVAVDLELILMADGSGSIDDSEFLLQRQGYARALRDPAIIQAIKGGMLGRIALAYVEWSGPELHVPIVNWTVIRNEADIAAFARVLEERPRELYGGGTAVGDAIMYGVRAIRENAFEGTRRVVDLSGDGPDRNGMPAVMGRDFAVAQRITVNGLPILAYDGDPLEPFFRDNVIGGPGAFYVAARGFKDFFSAIRRKLILEIAGTPPVGALQAAELPPSRSK